MSFRERFFAYFSPKEKFNLNFASSSSYFLSGNQLWLRMFVFWNCRRCWHERTSYKQTNNAIFLSWKAEKSFLFCFLGPLKRQRRLKRKDQKDIYFSPRNAVIANLSIDASQPSERGIKRPKKEAAQKMFRFRVFCPDFWFVQISLFQSWDIFRSDFWYFNFQTFIDLVKFFWKNYNN